MLIHKKNASMRPADWHRVRWAAGLTATAVLCAMLLLAGCGEPNSGPVEPRYDRTTCERCRMVLSDRRHAAQVRLAAGEGRSSVYFFDDLGCAVIWLDEQPERTERLLEIWVNDWRTGDWIDARSASYVPDQVTPMGYGLGAQSDAAPATLTYDQAMAHIFDVERRFNVHGGDAHQHHQH
jgi:nitrous oxide reductase accessory protein NosL